MKNRTIKTSQTSGFDKIKRAVDCGNNQPPLFENHGVIAHTGNPKSLPLCAKRLRKSRRSTMQLTNENTYQQSNWREYNAAQVAEKTRFQEMLHELCSNIENLPNLNGTGRTRLPMSEMVFAVVFKVYECVSGRRFMSDLSDAKDKGYLSKVPHFNSIFNYLELPEMRDCLQELIRLSSLPLQDIEVNFAVDASGFSTGQVSRWETEKYGQTVYRSKMKWLKCHLTCGVSTNIVTAVTITDRFHHDHGQFIPMIQKTAENFELNHVMADAAYLSEKNLDYVSDKGGVPFVPFKPNNTLGGRKRSQVWKTMYHYFHMHSEKFWNYYNKRSNVEATFSMIKRKFGERLRSKTETAQKNEILCKVLCHNLCVINHAMYELGIDTHFRKHSDSTGWFAGM
jgi:transposase